MRKHDVSRAPHGSFFFESNMTICLVCACVVLGLFPGLIWSLVLAVRLHVGDRPMHPLEEDV